VYSENLGLSKPEYFNYLSSSRAYKVDGTDDNKEFQETMVRVRYRLDDYFGYLIVLEIRITCSNTLMITVSSYDSILCTIVIRLPSLF